MFEDPACGVWADPFVGLAGSDEALFEEEGAKFGLVEGGEGVIEGVPEGFGEGAGAFRFWFCMGLLLGRILYVLRCGCGRLCRDHRKRPSTNWGLGRLMGIRVVG